MECDTLNSIALKFDTTPSEIAHLNKKPPGLSFSLFAGEVCWVWPAAPPKGVLMIVSNTVHSMSKPGLLGVFYRHWDNSNLP